mgnify:CR=1 FL=1
MDILHLVDRLEETIKKSPRIPFIPIHALDERRVQTLIDQMRTAIPEEVRRAQRISQEREQILTTARKEAEQLVRRAEERAEELVGEHSVARAAESRATAIREKGEREVGALRAEADNYVFNALCQLEEELRRTLRVVENGLRKIQADQATQESAAPES